VIFPDRTMEKVTSLSVWWGVCRAPRQGRAQGFFLG